MLAPGGGHMSNEVTLTEKGIGATVGILESV